MTKDHNDFLNNFLNSLSKEELIEMYKISLNSYLELKEGYKRLRQKLNELQKRDKEN